MWANLPFSYTSLYRPPCLPSSLYCLPPQNKIQHSHAYTSTCKSWVRILGRNWQKNLKSFASCMLFPVTSTSRFCSSPPYGFLWLEISKARSESGWGLALMTLYLCFTFESSIFLYLTVYIVFICKYLIHFSSQKQQIEMHQKEENPPLRVV